MKRKAYVVGAVILLGSLVVLVVVAMSGPTQAANPKSDFSRSRSPAKQALRSGTDLQVSNISSVTTVDAVAQNGATTASTEQSPTAPATSPVSPTAGTTANQTVTKVTGNLGPTVAQPVSKQPKQGAVQALLQSLSNVRL